MNTKPALALITATLIAASAFCHAQAQSPSPSPAVSPSPSPAASPSPSPFTGKKKGKKDGAKHEKGKFDPERKLEQLDKLLDLTQTQQNQILPILQKEADADKATMADTSLAQKEQKKQTREAAKSAETQISALLNPDQQAKLQASQGQKKGKRALKNDSTAAPAATPTASPSPAK
jgi:Spy/CpxP family protein refolding chaperone